MKQGHTHTHRGKRVIVILFDGTRFEDRFLEKTPTYMFLKNKGKISSKLVKAISEVRGSPRYKQD